MDKVMELRLYEFCIDDSCICCCWNDPQVGTTLMPGKRTGKLAGSCRYKVGMKRLEVRQILSMNYSVL